MAIIHRDTCLYLILASTIAGIIIFSTIFLARGHEDSAIDADFATLNTTVGRFRFEPEPKGRGTVGILLSCTFTFLFCIWTVVHPNVLPDSTLWTRSIYKAVSMVIAAINPEGVVISAYGQWRDARLLQQAINNYFEKLDPLPENSTETDKKEKARKISEWLGMDGAFFVVMGGFILDVSSSKSSQNITTPSIEKYSTVSPRKSSRYTATLTPPGFIKYLHEGYFMFETPPFDRAQIADKGKKSNIAKALSASQAVWLLVQSAARWDQGLHVTLLEIHMLIQVACTALLFYFWWYKPLDVNEPILLKLVKEGDGDNLAVTPIKYIENDLPEENALKLLADMEQVKIFDNEPLSHLDPADVERGYRGAPSTAWATGPATASTAVPNANPLISPYPDLPDWKYIHPLRRPFTITRSQGWTGMTVRALHDIVFYITGGTITEDMIRAPEGLKPRPRKNNLATESNSSQNSNFQPMFQIQGTDMSNTVVRDSNREGTTTPLTFSDESITLLPQVSKETQKRPKFDHSIENKRMFVEGVFICVIAFLHGLAWHSYFPTDTERLAWRLSCIGMFAFPLPAITIASLGSYHNDLSATLWDVAFAEYQHWQWVWHALLCVYDMAKARRKKETSPEIGYLTVLGHVFLIMTCNCLGLGYLVCILTITYESYASIRDPPPTTYDTPRWADYWPHF